MKDGLAYSAMKILSQYTIELYKSWLHRYLESTRWYLKKLTEMFTQIQPLNYNARI